MLRFGRTNKAYLRQHHLSHCIATMTAPSPPRWKVGARSRSLPGMGQHACQMTYFRCTSSLRQVYSTSVRVADDNITCVFWISHSVIPRSDAICIYYECLWTGLIHTCLVDAHIQHARQHRIYSCVSVLSASSFFISLSPELHGLQHRVTRFSTRVGVKRCET